MRYKFDKFKSLFYSESTKNKIKLEDQSNTYLKMEMYDLYAQMVANGYQPNKDQSYKITKFFRTKLNSTATTLLENNYRLNDQDCVSLMFNEGFLNDYKIFIATTSTEEEIVAINKKWRNVFEQISNKFYEKDFDNKLAMNWHKEFISLMQYIVSEFTLKGLCKCYELHAEKWKKCFSEDNYNLMILTILENSRGFKGDELLMLKALEKQLKEDYRDSNLYNINNVMVKTKMTYSEQHVEQKTKELVAENNSFKINQLPTEIQKIIIEIENNCEKLNNIKDVEIQFIVNNTMDKVLPETLKKYLTIDEEYRETLRNHQGKNAKDFFVESLTNMNDKLNELLIAKNESRLREMAINATYTKNIKNS